MNPPPYLALAELACETFWAILFTPAACWLKLAGW